MRDGLADFQLVSDEQIQAAVLADPERSAGRRVVAICSGGNASAAEIGALGLC